MLEGLGIGAGGDALAQAKRTGAATMAAMQTLDGRWNLMMAVYTRHLDGPPLGFTPAAVHRKQ